MKCRQATRLISDAQERQLMTKEKIGLNLHLAICTHSTKLWHIEKINEGFQRIKKRKTTSAYYFITSPLTLLHVK